MSATKPVRLPTPTPVHIDSLRADRKRRAMGSINDLAASIEKDGLTYPIVVLVQKGKNRLVLDGIRRIAAYRQLGRANIPAILVRWQHEAVHVIKNQLHERSPIDPNKPKRVRMSVRDFVEFGATLASIERNPATEPEGYAGVRDIVRALGIATSTYGQIRSLVADADGDIPDRLRRLAVDAIAAIDSQPNHRQFSPLYRSWHENRRAIAAELNATDLRVPAVPDLLVRAPTTRVVPATRPEQPAVQRNVYHRALATLAGLNDGLEALGPVHPSLTDQERTEWAMQISTERKRLGDLIRKLRS